jgi:hypothetical protein
MEKTKLYAQIGDEVREFTEAEYAQHKIDMTAFKAGVKADEAKADKRQTILDRLGITDDEFKTLIS